MEKPIAYKNEHGIWIYNRLPEGIRVATIDDFLDVNGELKLGVNFLAKSFHFPRYEAHVLKPNFMSKWQIWLVQRHLFVLMKE